MTKTAYLVKETSVCELFDTVSIVIKWVKAEDLKTNTTIEIIEKRELTENWVFENEIFSMCESTKEPYAITNNYSVK